MFDICSIGPHLCTAYIRCALIITNCQRILMKGCIVGADCGFFMVGKIPCYTSPVGVLVPAAIIMGQILHGWDNLMWQRPGVANSEYGMIPSPACCYWQLNDPFCSADHRRYCQCLSVGCTTPKIAWSPCVCGPHLMRGSLGPPISAP